MKPTPMRPAILALATLLGILSALLAGPAYLLASGRIDLETRWSEASRDPTGLAPDPAITPEAVVQIYGARAFNWRGAFGVHTWIAVKPADAPTYSVSEVIGWRVCRGPSALALRTRGAARQWVGHAPAPYADLPGAAGAAPTPPANP